MDILQQDQNQPDRQIRMAAEILFVIFGIASACATIGAVHHEIYGKLKRGTLLNKVVLAAGASPTYSR